MLIIVAKNTLKVGGAEGFKKVAAPLVEASRAEAGNISYDLFEDVKNPDVLTFIEKWEDEAAIAFHNSTPHFTSIVPQLAQFAGGEKDVRTYRQAI